MGYQMAETVAVRFRRKRFLFGRLRRLQVLVDGEVRAHLTYGEEHSFALAPGVHTLQAKMDWGRSPELVLEIRPNDHLSVECGARFLLLAFLFIFVAPTRIFTLAPVSA